MSFNQPQAGNRRFTDRGTRSGVIAARKIVVGGRRHVSCRSKRCGRGADLLAPRNPSFASLGHRGRKPMETLELQLRRRTRAFRFGLMEQPRASGVWPGNGSRHVELQASRAATHRVRRGGTARSGSRRVNVRVTWRKSRTACSCHRNQVDPELIVPSCRSFRSAVVPHSAFLGQFGRRRHRVV